MAWKSPCISIFVPSVSPQIGGARSARAQLSFALWLHTES